MKRFDITSYDTFSTLDGPGIRTVVYLFGCRKRCVYCHNPESFCPSRSRPLEFSELARVVRNCRPYYGTTGGLTFSGGEPLLQAERINEFMTELGSEAPGYVLETAGEELCASVRRCLSLAAHVYVDLKFTSDADYGRWSGSQDGLSTALLTLDFLRERPVPHTVRHVVVPGLNDSFDDLQKTARLVRDRTGCRTLEFLPYHTMGSAKYAGLGLSYGLEGTPALDKAWLQGQTAKLRREFPELEIRP